MINFTDQSYHGKYQELPDVKPKKAASAEQAPSHRLTEDVRTASDNVCCIYDDPDGCTAVVYLPNVKPDAVFNFISNLENFVSLSQQVRCATPKSRGNRVRGKSTRVQHLDVTYVRRSYYFWEVLETADSTFQAADPEIALTVTFVSRNTRGEKTSSIFTLEDHPAGGTQVINKVALSDQLETSGGLLGCCWDQRTANIKHDQRRFLNGLSDAIHASTSPMALFDDEYIV